MSRNPFFCGQVQKQRSGLSACLPPADDWYLSRGLTRSCDFSDAKPSPLRIVKRGERTQSLGMLREDSELISRKGCRDISPTEYYHRALLSVTKRQGRATRSYQAGGSTQSLVKDNSSKEDVKRSHFSLGTSRYAHERVVSAETMSSTGSSEWNSFGAAGVSTRVSSLDEHVDDSSLRGGNLKAGHQFAGSPNEEISLQNVLPHVLSPHVSITTDTASCYDGRRCIWAAIEVSGKLSHTYSAETVVGIGHHETPGKESVIDHQLDRFFKHGCLYDLSVEVKAVPGTKILQVFQDNSFPTAVYSGSSVFLLVQVQFDAEVADIMKQRKKRRQKSDELFADLEAQLGDSQVAYMHLCVSYRHSAFPEYSGPEILAGISYLQSQMKTTATASLKRNNACSHWSPRPTSNLDCLREVVCRHWGPDKAVQIMRQIALTQPSGKKLMKTQSKPILGQPHHVHATNQQGRQHSAGFQLLVRPPPVALRKEGTRQASARSVATGSMSQERKSSTGGPGSVFQKEIDHASIKKKSFGAEILRSLTPALGGIHPSSLNEELPADMKGVKDGKDSSFWGWGAWF